jgi:hypothetical protein
MHSFVIRISIQTWNFVQSFYALARSLVVQENEENTVRQQHWRRRYFAVLPRTHCHSRLACNRSSNEVLPMTMNPFILCIKLLIVKNLSYGDERLKDRDVEE